MSKAPKSAPGLEATSRSDHEVGAMVASNPGVDVPECVNYVTRSNHEVGAMVAICYSSLILTLDCMLMVEAKLEPSDTKLSRTRETGLGR
jgi:hypothetical protein